MACWYPQMGGFTSCCVVVTSGADSCFSAYVWHDGEFPFDDGSESGPVRHIHHCMAEQFVNFGELVLKLQATPPGPAPEGSRRG